MTKTFWNGMIRNSAPALAAVALALTVAVTQSMAQQDDKPKPDAPASAAKAPAEAAPGVVARLGSAELTGEEIDTVVASLPPESQARLASQPQGKRQLAAELLRIKALAGEAEKRKLDQDPKVKARLDAARREALAEAMLKTLDRGEDADKKYYDEHAADFDRLTARHILISADGAANDPSDKKPVLTDAQAKKKADDLRAQLEKGADFAKLVDAETYDLNSKATGGQYSFGRDEMVPAFEKTSYQLKLNEISQPVRTQFGYHIIQLQKREPADFEKVKQSVPRQRFERLMQEVVGDAEPKFEDSYFAVPAKKADAPPAPTKTLRP